MNHPLAIALLAAVLAACAGSGGGGGTTPSPVAGGSPSASATSPSPSPKVVPDNLCDAIDPPTVDSTLGLKVNPGLWDGSHNCVFVSVQPQGGLTLDRLTESAVTTRLGAALTAGAATPLPGLGKSAVVSSRTGIAAPAPATDALVLVDLGTYGLSIHASGPAITLEAVVRIAHDILG